MKWIGQSITDFIARFRAPVYLEDDVTLSTGKSITMDEYTSGTISITKIQDSGTSFNDNDTSLMTAAAIADKVEAYGYSTTTGDITGVTAGTNLSGGGATGGVTINLADASTSVKGAASFNSNHFSTSSGAVSLGTAMTWADTTITTDSLTLTSSTADKPTFTLKDTTNDAQATIFRMEKDGGAGTNGDNVGEIEFHSKDASNNTQMFGKIFVEIDEATHGQESGAMELRVASHDGEQKAGVAITGGSEEDEVDVAIGYGTNSVTTIAGDLTVTGSALGISTRVYGDTIKILPSDFLPNEDSLGNGLHFDDGASNIGIQISNNATEMWAFVDIPEGKKATHIDVYGSTANTLGVYECDVNASGIGSAKGVGAVNTQLDFTDVNSTATNYLGIYIATGNTSNRIYGGILTIADI